MADLLIVIITANKLRGGTNEPKARVNGQWTKPFALLIRYQKKSNKASLDKRQAPKIHETSKPESSTPCTVTPSRPRPGETSF